MFKTAQGKSHRKNIFHEFFKKNSENAFPLKQLMVLSESAPQQLSNEWSCQ
jgi:hypothetical protein